MNSITRTENKLSNTELQGFKPEYNDLLKLTKKMVRDGEVTIGFKYECRDCV